MTAAEIAETLQMPLSTVSAVLKRNGVGRLGRIGPEPAIRYERSRPGELVHVDIKKLGRVQVAGKRVGCRTTDAGRPRRRNAHGYDRGISGWEYVHVAVDDYSRLAYVEVLPDEKAATAIGFLRRALTFYARHGIQAERVLTDNGSAYISTIHALTCRKLGIRHLRTRPPPTPDQRQSRALHPHPGTQRDSRELPINHLVARYACCRFHGDRYRPTGRTTRNRIACLLTGRDRTPATARLSPARGYAPWGDGMLLSRARAIGRPAHRVQLGRRSPGELLS
jgi:hypothetical protein